MLLATKGRARTGHTGWLIGAVAVAGQLSVPLTAQTGRPVYERAVVVSRPASQACAALDAPVFEHTGGLLRPMRLLTAGGRPVPFSVTESGSAGQLWEPAGVREFRDSSVAGHPGWRQWTFTLAMPPRAYTEVQLATAWHGFMATAEVRGLGAEADGARDTSGSSAGGKLLQAQPILFDTWHDGADAQGLTLRLQEATYPRLAVRMLLRPQPAMVPRGKAALPTIAPALTATVPPSRESQVLYAPLAEAPLRDGHAVLLLPAHVPVGEAVFTAADSRAPFVRQVQIRAVPLGEAGRADSDDSVEAERGTIYRVGQAEGAGTGTASVEGAEQTLLRLPLALGANLRDAARVDVDVAPRGAPLTGVQLRMRLRQICFRADEAGEYVLMYGGTDDTDAASAMAAKQAAMAAAVPRAQADSASVETAALGVEVKTAAPVRRTDDTAALTLTPSLSLLEHWHVWLLMTAVTVCLLSGAALLAVELRRRP